MFRRRWSGLPDDPDFPAGLKELGYFVNEIDEIRSLAKPSFYFKFFLSKNTRVNDRQRFAFNLAAIDLIHTRLAALGLTKLPLPLGTPASSPHAPIFVSADLRSARRVVVVFGERDQDLGVLAHRVIGGRGGVDEGSMVSIVRALQGGGGDVGVVLANSGEAWWWPEGGRALSYRQSTGVRMASSVHKGICHRHGVNGIPENGDVDEHVRCVFESVLGNGEFVGEGAVVQVLGLSEGASAVEKYLDENWERWEGRVGCLAMVGAGMCVDDLKNEGFKTFLRKKARVYITNSAELATPIANSNGNPNTVTFTSYGCPVLSSGEPYYSEVALVKAKGHVLPWMAEVYKAGKAYANPVMDVKYADEQDEDTNQGQWADGLESWAPAVGETRPSRSTWGADGVEGNDRVVEEDANDVEFISREEWERRKEEGEDGDPSKVVVL